MAIHQVQLRRGLSTAQFMTPYGVETSCAQALSRSRRPQSYRRPERAGRLSPWCVAGDNLRSMQIPPAPGDAAQRYVVRCP